MADKTLARLEDRELLKPFTITSALGITHRSKQVFAELEQRGYLYDSRRRDFITCAQWNKRHADAPRDCEKQAKT